MDDRQKYTELVSTMLVQDGFDLNNKQLNGFDVGIGIKKKFEWSWLATQLTIGVIVGTSDSVSKDVIQLYSKTTLKYLLKSKTGLPRGLQTGVVSFALLASKSVSDDARKWVEQKPRKHFAAFEMPLIYDISNNVLYYYHGTPKWGAVYYQFFRDFIESHFK